MWKPKCAQADLSQMMWLLLPQTATDEKAGGKVLSLFECLSTGLSIMVHYLSLLDLTLYHHGDKYLYSHVSVSACVCVRGRERKNRTTDSFPSHNLAVHQYITVTEFSNAIINAETHCQLCQ